MSEPVTSAQTADAVDPVRSAETAVARESAPESQTSGPVPDTATGTRGSKASAARPGARRTNRTRAPKQDSVLTEAVALAREAVALGGADASSVGEHVGVRVHEDRLLTHLFTCELPGYPGWTWYATVARAPRSKHVTVCESGLLSGPHSLLAPDWVPWEERMQAVQGHEQGGQGDTDPSTPAGADENVPSAAETAIPSEPSRAADSTPGGEAENRPGSADAPARQATAKRETPDGEAAQDPSAGAAGARVPARAVVPADPFDTGVQLPEDGPSS